MRFSKGFFRSLIVGLIVAPTFLLFQNCGKSGFQAMPTNLDEPESLALSPTQPTTLPASGKLFLMKFNGGPLAAGELRDQLYAEMNLATNSIRTAKTDPLCFGTSSVNSSSRMQINQGFQYAATHQDSIIASVQDLINASADIGYYYLVLADAGETYTAGQVPEGALYYLIDSLGISQVLQNYVANPAATACQ